jgi:hypothetical protein
MPRSFAIKSAAIVIAATLSLGCNKSRDSGSTTSAPVDSAPVADFPSLDAKAWVNGSSVSLGEARGKHVVLVEAWHPA